MEIGFGERLIDPGLVGPQRAPALKHEGNLLERRALRHNPNPFQAPKLRAHT